MTFAGTPPTIVYGGTSFVTTAPEATTAPSPTLTPGSIIERLQIQAYSPISVSAPLPQNIYRYNRD